MPQTQLITLRYDGTQKVQTFEGRTPSLEETKAAIGGGYLQLIPHLDSYEGQPCFALCDEEGKLKNFPHNRYAQAIWDSQLVLKGVRDNTDYLVGDIAILTGDPKLLADW